jgi:hypothetical protein
LIPKTFAQGTTTAAPGLVGAASCGLASVAEEGAAARSVKFARMPRAVYHTEIDDKKDSMRR